MREILFRAKTIEDTDHANKGEWVHGFIAEDQTGDFFNKIGAVGIWGKTYAGNNFFVAVDPETVGEYTGLQDKNGVKIFEGDILLVDTARGSEPHYQKRVVEWKTPYFSGFVYDKAEYKPQYHEVIGNIHDNPELLEGKTNEV